MSVEREIGLSEAWNMYNHNIITWKEFLDIDRRINRNDIVR